MAAVVTEAPAIVQRSVSLGGSVPAFTAHAISVSLPTWDDVVGYEEGDKRVLDKMVTGYPRFFIHRSIQKVQQIGLLPQHTVSDQSLSSSPRSVNKNLLLMMKSVFCVQPGPSPNTVVNSSSVVHRRH
jgi:hypothetical protein